MIILLKILMKNIICNFIFEEKDKKKMDRVFIPSHGIGEIQLDLQEMH